MDFQALVEAGRGLAAAGVVLTALAVFAPDSLVNASKIDRFTTAVIGVGLLAVGFALGTIFL